MECLKTDRSFLSSNNYLCITWFSRICSYMNIWHDVLVYSHWLGPEPGPGQGQGPGRMGCMVLIRTFHTAPEQGQRRTPGTFFRSIFQVLKMCPVMNTSVLPCPCSGAV